MKNLVKIKIIIILTNPVRYSVTVYDSLKKSWKIRKSIITKIATLKIIKNCSYVSKLAFIKA